MKTIKITVMKMAQYDDLMKNMKTQLSTPAI